jgi:hypothetical protein
MQRSRNQGGTSDDELIRRFVATFERLDKLICNTSKPPPSELLGGTDPDVDWLSRRPAAIVTGRVQLEPLYRRLPGPFPDLYEQLVLT